MSIDFTGITNQNEFYTNYYLAAIFEQDLKEVLQSWDQQAQSGERMPYEKLGALRHEFFALQEQMRKLKSAAKVLDAGMPFVQNLLNVLGYNFQPKLKDIENGAVPIVGEVLKADGSPYLWAILVASEPDDKGDPLHRSFLPEQYEDEPDPAKQLLGDDLEMVIAKHIYATAEPPRWILAIQYNCIILIDRSKWSDKRLLQFDLREILNRRETSTLKATAALLYKESLCPDSGNSLLDYLDENSHKHAFAVSEDLKYAAREAVELIGNEAIWYIREKQKKAVFTRPELAKQLTEESLRYLYRLLFLFYLEARAEKLGTIPMCNEAYKTGYSLESLRELEMTPLLTPETQNGYFFDDSIAILFGMISNGVYPEKQGELPLADTPRHHEFSIEKIESHLFDVKQTPLLQSVRLRNSVWQKVIQLLSLSREQNGKNQRRGRVSYAQLGIIQLGAVYEGLLSYRGFFAETDLYEVKKSGDAWNPLDQAFFVTAEQLEGYTKDERVYDDDTGNLIKYPKGTFIYRLAGRDREKSASYYTPTSLTQCLVKYALKELIGEKPGDEHYKTADDILQLTVCEPAMGSAAFLNEAVNQLADAYLRRKQQETGQWIAHDRIEEETQHVRMFLADRNIFGVDLNPVAVELGEISLWLNSMTRANFVPWFGGQLVCGNSLIGARRQVYRTALASRGKKGAQTWLDSAPERVMPGTRRTPTTIYHFLLPDTGMADYTDKVIKTMAQEKIAAIREWKKNFVAPFSEEDALLLERLSSAVDALWIEHTKQLRELRTIATDKLSIFGHEIKEEGNLSLADKDQRLSDLYAKQIKNSTPYRRLKMVMDYWCALWFWPIEKADELPSRDEYLMELQYILQGARMQEFGTYAENGQGFLFPTEERQQQLDFSEDLGTVNINELCDAFPRLQTVQQIADSQHFLHWELEFADVFHDHGGFDLVLGNPPWVKVQWNETGLLSDYQPMFAIKSLSATDVAELRNETIEKFGISKQYLHEYEGITGTQNFLNAICNYPVLKNVQTNLYKCFLPQAWMINTANGVSGFLHPEGVYDDPAGGKLRAETYSRLRDHFQFINELRLFAEVDHHTKFSVNIYGTFAAKPHFQHIANLFAVFAVEESFQNSASKVGGIKDDNDNWNRNGHPDRVIRVTGKELELFVRLYDEPGTPFNEARLPAIHARQLTDVLEKIMQYALHLQVYNSDYFSTQFWHETNDQKKTHTMRRDTQFPTDAERMILSGPHFFVGNSFYKSPRFPCLLNSDYDTIDLTAMPENYLQRSNYVPDCDMEEYHKRTPYCPWDVSENPVTHEKTILRRVTDYYRLAFRGMLSQSGERTLTSAIIPCAYAHINGVKSICPRGCVSHTSTKTMQDPVDVSHTSTEKNGLTPIDGFARLLDLAAVCFSVIGDFYIKSTGRSNLYESDLANLPYITDNRLRLLVLLLSCLTRPYADLWHGAWRDEFVADAWAKDDPRLPKDTFSKLTPEWTWETPLRTDYARRQALVEIDVLVARALGLTVEELCTIYRIQFPVLKQNENDTWYDQTGRIVFTCSKGLPGVGFDRAKWNEIKDLKAGDPCPTLPRNLDWLPEDQRESADPIITYYPPFDKCDREADYRTVWAYFDKRELLNITGASEHV